MNDWQIILNQARKALESKIEWKSLGGLTSYSLISVTDDTININRLGGGENAIIGKQGAIRSITKLKQLGSINKSELIDSVVRQTTLVFLHPNIFFDSESNLISWNEHSPSLASIEHYIKEVSNDELKKVQRLINERNKQSQFRENIMTLYKGRCAITGIDIPEVLEASHIDPHAKSGINENNNGILLRKDIHALFDNNLIRINPENFEILLSTRIQNNPVYKELHGSILNLPISNKYLLERWLTQ